VPVIFHLIRGKTVGPKLEEKFINRNFAWAL